MASLWRVWHFVGASPRTPYEQSLYRFVHTQLQCPPQHLNLYVQAMTHKSCFSAKEGPRAVHINERLEYLGDAVLDLCVAELLFKAYPMAGEGMLTDMRSQIVNTTHLALLAEELQLVALLRYRGNALSQNVIGSALEAFIGAVYLDQGYSAAKHFVQHRVLTPYVSLAALRKEVFNHKGKLVEWAQREKKNLRFETISIRNSPLSERFEATLFLDTQALTCARAGNKKEAQQLAAEEACKVLKLT